MFLVIWKKIVKGEFYKSSYILNHDIKLYEILNSLSNI